MSDNHENFQDGFHTAQNPDSAGTQKTAETPYAYGSTYSAGSSQQNVPQTYTWAPRAGRTTRAVFRRCHAAGAA